MADVLLEIARYLLFGFIITILYLYRDTLLKVIRYALRFYLSRLKLILVFSIPVLLALLIPLLVVAPTYLALGGVFVRTGSIPELSLFDIIFTAIAYIASLFLISDTIVNVNLIILSKRTLTNIKKTILGAMGTYAMRIFYVCTLMLLVIFVFQLITYENSLQSWLYPLFVIILSFLLLFVPPAVVIDNLDTPSAIKRSVLMALEKPVLVLAWGVVGFVLVVLTEILSFAILPHPISEYAVLLINSFIILPFLVVLQTQMYMEKYPLASERSG